MRKFKLYINRNSIIFWIVCFLVSIFISVVGYNIKTFQWWLSIIILCIGYGCFSLVKFKDMK